MLKRLIYILLILPLACIEPFPIETPEGLRLLTVDGYITTDPGPHTIRLSRSDRYGSVFEGVVRPVAGAAIGIRDNLGNVTFLSETATGVYQTAASFQAQIGLSYSIEIRLVDGSSYFSLPELVQPVPQIDSVTFQVLTVPTDDRLSDGSGVQLIAHFRDPGDERNFYHWRNSASTFVLVANPELHTLPPTHPTNPRGPDPKDCCAICYQQEEISRDIVRVLDDSRFNGLATRAPVLFIQDNGLRFKDTYRVDIQQLSVSERAHRFLKLVGQQQSITGSVFDPPPANIRSNIFNANDPSEVVLGYFFASDVDTKRVYIKNEDLSLRQLPQIIPDDCRTVEGASIDPPADWNPGG